MKVKFVDLQEQYQAIKSEINQAVQKVFESGEYTLGPFVEDFENNFAKAHQAKYCLGVVSGTAALHLALWALGIKEGDEVIVPTHTFIASAASISLTGAKPVFVDCEENFFNIDFSKIEQAITPKTKAILAVHLYGQPANLNQLVDIAKKHNLWLVEDCAQAHLATYNNKPVGTFGEVGCFSFYPSKNLGAYGEGGAVITNDENLYVKMKALRQHGSFKKYYHDFVGQNYRLHAIQGAILGVKLKHLKDWTKARQQVVKWYRESLVGIKQIQLPKEMPNVQHVYHLFVIKAEKRDELISFLESEGISAGIHYPVPCHLQKAYSNLRYKVGDFPITERIVNQILSLPVFPELKKEEVLYIAEKIRKFYQIEEKTVSKKPEQAKIHL